MDGLSSRGYYENNPAACFGYYINPAHYFFSNILITFPSPVLFSSSVLLGYLPFPSYAISTLHLPTLHAYNLPLGSSALYQAIVLVSDTTLHGRYFSIHSKVRTAPTEHQSIERQLYFSSIASLCLLFSTSRTIKHGVDSKRVIATGKTLFTYADVCYFQ